MLSKLSNEICGFINYLKNSEFESKCMIYQFDALLCLDHQMLLQGIIIYLLLVILF